MCVTEFAYIKLKENYSELEFLEALMVCQEVQDEWIRRHQPHLLSPGANLSTFSLQKSSPNEYLLITAPWDSPDGHHEWIRSEDNQREFAKLRDHISTDDDAVTLFHMDPAGCQQKLPHGLLASGSGANVCRIEVEPGSGGKKELLQRMYRTVENEMLATTQQGGPRVWAGWRIERKSDDKEVLVVIWDRDFHNAPLQEMIDSFDDKQQWTVAPVA